MGQVVVDTLRYFCIYENEILREGFDGYRVEESFDDRNFVIFKEIADTKELERKYVLPENVLPRFIELEARYRRNFLAQQTYLFNVLVQVEQFWKQNSMMELKDVTDAYYSEPTNYIHFVALNMTKTQFFKYAKERICLPANALVLN